MAGKIETIKYDKSKLLSQYKQHLSNKSFYIAMNVFNRLKGFDLKSRADNKNNNYYAIEKVLEDYNFTELVLGQTYIYSLLGNTFYEIDCLLRVVADESFFKYNAKAVANKIALFFTMYYEQDTIDYYLNLLKNRGGAFESLDLENKSYLNLPDNGLHFVDDDGNYKMGEAINEMALGKVNDAIEIINSVKVDDKDYVHSQNFLASIYMLKGDNKTAKKILFDLVDSNIADEETVKVLGSLHSLNDNEIKRVVELTQKLKNEDNINDLSILQASLLLKIGESLNAIEELKSVKPPAIFDENYLKIIIKAYAMTKDIENLKQQLKTYCTLFPNMPLVRFALTKLENGEEFELIDYLSMIPNSKISKEIRTYLIKFLRNNNNFDMLECEEVVFLLKLAESIRDYEILKRIITKTYNSKNYGVLEDLSVSIFTTPEAIQLIIQVLIEERHKKDWLFLNGAYLKKQTLLYPEFFNSRRVEDKDKLEYLLSCYAQTFSLLLFMNKDVSNIHELLNGKIEEIYNLEFDMQSDLSISENLVYVFSLFASLSDEDVEKTFYYIEDETKNKLKKLI